MKKNNLVYDIRQISTIRELIETSADEFGARPAFVLKKDGEIYEHNYRAEISEVRALSTYFNSKGLEGKRIAVIGKNSYHWVLTYLAVCAGTGIIVPIDKDLKAPEIFKYS